MRWLFLMIIAAEATITHSGNAKEDFLELFQQKGKLSINSEATKDIIILYSCFIKAVSQYRNVKNTINYLESATTKFYMGIIFSKRLEKICINFMSITPSISV